MHWSKNYNPMTECILSTLIAGIPIENVLCFVFRDGREELVLWCILSASGYTDLGPFLSLLNTTYIGIEFKNFFV